MRVESLTFFRFIAAFIVVVFHFGKDTELANLAPGFLTSGPEMVTFFFVLSGFVMILSYYAKTDFSTKKYWENRAVRILPSYIISMLAVFILMKPESTTGMVLGTFLLQAWVPSFPLLINFPAWSLSAEAFFYALFPSLLNKIKSRNWSPYHLITFSLIFWAITQIILTILLNSNFYHGYPSKSHDLIFYFPLAHVCSFFLGIAGGYMILKNKEQIPYNKFYAYLALLTSGLITFILLQNKEQMSELVGINLPTGASLFSPMFFIFIVALIMAKETFVYKFLSLKPLVILGEASYALYIFQSPVFELSSKFIFPLFHFDSYDKYFYVYLLVLTASSVACLYLIEKPIKRLYMRRQKMLA